MADQPQAVASTSSSWVPIVVGVTVGAIGIGGLIYIVLTTQQTSPPPSPPPTTGTTVLTLTASTTQVAEGGTVTFTVVATNSVTNNPVSGITVTLVDTTTSTNIQSEVTDSIGSAVFVYTVPTTLPVGSYVFNAVSS